MSDYNNIKCPYCFKTFSHDQVFFRSATALTEVDLDPTGRGETLEEIEFMPDGEEKTSRIQAYHLNENFLIRDDERYTAFWDDFGTTSEVNSGADKTILDYKRPLLDPYNRYLVPSGPQVDGDEFVYKIEDCYGRETQDRVCPHCHNPLPPNYGKYPVKFLSVIGISSAGKTVFLSKLIQRITSYAAGLGMSALPANESSRNFIKDNKVAKDTPLPGGTPVEYLSQPLFYNLTYRLNGKYEKRMFVIYDIAGEICVNTAKIHRYAKFVQHSDGMFILLDPQQFSCLGGKAPGLVENVLSTINNVFADTGINTVPLALCISKSDIMRQANLLPEICFTDVRTIDDGNGNKLFCATDYNEISNYLSNLFEKNESDIKVALEMNYRNFNYFAFTTLNCNVITDENGQQFPEKEPEPKRIEEPLFWMFKQFGFINSDIAITDHSIFAKEMQNKIKKKNELEAYLATLKGPFKRSERKSVCAQIENLAKEIINLRKS